MKIVAVDSLIMNHGIKCLVYGRAGVGKTSLVRTAPNPLILSAESGLLSLKGSSLPAVQITSVDDLVTVHQWAEQGKLKQFQTLYIDSISEIGEIVLANAKEKSRDPRQAYGTLIEKMQMTIKAFRDLKGFNIVMVAKEEVFKDEANGTAKFIPSLPGAKLGNQLPYLFDEVFHMDIGKNPKGGTFRYLLTQPTFQFEAKDRSGKLANKEEANLTSVFQKILS